MRSKILISELLIAACYRRRDFEERELASDFNFEGGSKRELRVSRSLVLGFSLFVYFNNPSSVRGSSFPPLFNGELS